MSNKQSRKIISFPEKNKNPFDIITVKYRGREFWFLRKLHEKFDREVFRLLEEYEQKSIDLDNSRREFREGRK